MEALEVSQRAFQAASVMAEELEGGGEAAAHGGVRGEEEGGVVRSQ